LSELSEEIREQKITLENRLDHFPGGAIPVKGSKLWLMSVFRNLVNNGIKYGGLGCTIVIDWEKQGTNCRLNVYNSGKPIPEEKRTLLFSNHSLKHRKDKGDRSGLGIGLYLSRDVVNSLGGDIWYEPKTSGSKFVVSLPRN
jgi:signal transduction histidine kinase